MAMGSTGAAAPGGVELFLLVRLGGLLDHAAAAVEAIRRDAMTQVRLPRLRVGGECGRGKPVVGAMHAAPGGRLATFLNRHNVLVRPKRALTSNESYQLLASQQIAQLRKGPLRHMLRRLLGEERRGGRHGALA